MDYRYAVDILTEDGRVLEHAAVAPDWSQAVEWTYFDAVRKGSLPALARTGAGVVEPIWDARQGEPYVSGFRVIVRAVDGREASREIPKTFLRRVARDLSADFVRRGRLTAGRTYRWVASAFPAEGSATPATTDDDLLGIEEVARPIPLDDMPMAAFVERAVLEGAGEEPADHVPVFFPVAIIDEAIDLAERAGDVETGGVLVGRLHRDVDGRGPGVQELFLEITAQVPAPHTVSGSTKLTFTGETWAAVRAAIALRRRDEVMAGWWHSHPDFCRLRQCPPERRRLCTASSPFFSEEDVHMHGVCFPSAHQVALLVSDSTAAGGFTSSLFGWFQGQVVPRGFHVLRREPVAPTKGADHAAHATAS